MRATNAVPNKPMVLTAPATTEERSLGSGRQHIGEPLGSQRRAASDDQRVTKKHEPSHEYQGARR